MTRFSFKLISMIYAVQITFCVPGPALCAGETSKIQEIDKLIEQGAFSRAKPLVEGLLYKESENPVYHLTAARLYKKMGLWSNAIVEYEWVRRNNPKLAEPYIALSEMYLENLSSDMAQSMAEEACYLAPDNKEARAQLISALIANYEYSKAEKELEKLIRKNPGNARVMYLAFELKKKVGDFKDAKKYLEKAISLKPEKISWLLDLFDTCEALKDIRCAHSAIDEYLDRSPDSIDALLKKAWLEEKYDFDFNEASKTYARILELDSLNWVAEAGIERLERKRSDTAETVKRSVRKFWSDVFAWLESFSGSN